MSGRDRYLEVSELPGRPDPEFCLPEPPHAPGWVGGASRDKRSADRMPSSPPGQGPVMAWFPGHLRGPLLVVGFWAVVMVAIFTAANGFGWMNLWPVWLVFGFFWFLIYRAQRLKECVAGVEWLARRRRWVRLYELVEVTYLGIPFGPLRLRLRDSGGRKLTIRLRDVRADQLVWDLTYNGILHSVVAGGARTNERLHLDLQVPYPASRANSGPG